MFSSKASFQRDFLDMSGHRPDISGELYDHCNLNFTGLVRPFSGHVWVLTQLCHLREISSMSGLSRFGVFIPVWPVWWTGLTSLLWQLQWLVFSDSYKRHSTPSLVGCWFLTICILFQQPLELSPTTLCEIQVLCGGFQCWVERFVCEPFVFKPWALWDASSIREAFITLGGEAS
jgi:hypothetical protein